MTWDPFRACVTCQTPSLWPPLYMCTWLHSTLALDRLYIHHICTTSMNTHSHTYTCAYVTVHRKIEHNAGSLKKKCLHLYYRHHPDIELSKIHNCSFNHYQCTHPNRFNPQASLMHLNQSFPRRYIYRVMPNCTVHNRSHNRDACKAHVSMYIQKRERERH